jgi:4-hydroxybenzoate polyprenyltransferase
MDVDPILTRFKLRENFILAGAPVTGFLFGSLEVTPESMSNLVLLTLAAFLLFVGVRIYQGRKFNEDGNRTFDEVLDAVLAIGFVGVSCAITIEAFDGALAYWIPTAILCFLYTNDFTRLWRIPILPTALFFPMCLFGFAYGFEAAGFLTINSWLFGVYFAMIFTAGQLAGELVRVDEDPERCCNASAFGTQSVGQFSFGMFAFAFGFVGILTFARFLPFLHALPFLLAFPLQIEAVLRYGGQSDPDAPRKYQLYYRTLYGIAVAAYFVIRFAKPVVKMIKMMAQGLEP